MSISCWVGIIEIATRSAYRNSGKRYFVQDLSQVVDVMSYPSPDLVLGILQAQRKVVLQFEHPLALVGSANVHELKLQNICEGGNNHSLDQISHDHHEIAQSENEPDDNERLVGHKQVTELPRLPWLE